MFLFIERDIILEELRCSHSGQEVSYFATNFEGLQHAARLPIGTQESLLNATPKSLSKFYRQYVYFLILPPTQTPPPHFN